MPAFPFMAAALLPLLSEQSTLLAVPSPTPGSFQLVLLTLKVFFRLVGLLNVPCRKTHKQQTLKRKQAEGDRDSAWNLRPSFLQTEIQACTEAASASLEMEITGRRDPSHLLLSTLGVGPSHALKSGAPSILGRSLFHTWGSRGQESSESLIC